MIQLNAKVLLTLDAHRLLFLAILYSFTFVSMVTSGVHTNASQFYISLSPSKHLNGRSVVFGRVVEGDDSLKAIEKVSRG
jgi:cyclophilin family peptidyl-prolyl cis-trans isomerase